VTNPPLGALARSLVRDPLLRRMALRAGRPETEPTSDSAVVFAPHPDDETLACGGVVARKVGKGARVRVVVLTDGSLSPRPSVAPDRLAAARAAEAVEAAAVLGVPGDDVTLLGFPDGRLGEHADEAIARVSELLRGWRPREVYVPHGSDPQTDHRAAHRVVLAALSALGHGTVVFEYPVWLWYGWPWVRRSPGSWRSAARILGLSVYALGLLVLHFRWVVDVGATLDVKRRALARHRTQMEAFGDDPSWPTLGHLSDGDFLACFFRGHEVFRRRVVEGGAPGDGARG